MAESRSSSVSKLFQAGSRDLALGSCDTCFENSSLLLNSFDSYGLLSS